MKRNNSEIESSIMRILNVIRRIIHINYKYYLRELYILLNANNIILTYPNVKAKDHRVNLLDYDIDKTGHPHYNKDNPYNLGDELGKVVIDWMLEKRADLSRDMWVKKKKFLLTIGSGVFYYGYQDVTFWGTGVLCDIHNQPWYRKFLNSKYYRKLDFRAVRGPLTRDVVQKLGHKCPEIYGDPGILMPLIYKPDVTKEHDYAIIPQYVTEEEIREQHPDDFIISMNTNDYKKVISDIISCKKVVSSSLHGVILAEAYGVPAVWYRGLMEEIDFKYLDYYASTGRYNIQPATSVEEALATEPLPLPDLTKLYKGLLNSFPYDLWTDNQ